MPFGTTLTTALGPSTERDPTSIGYPPSDPRYAVSPSRTEPQASPATCIRTPVAWLIVAVQTTKSSDQQTIQSHSKCRQGLKSPLRLTPNGVAPSKVLPDPRPHDCQTLNPSSSRRKPEAHVSATGQRVSSDNKFDTESGLTFLGKTADGVTSSYEHTSITTTECKRATIAYIAVTNTPIRASRQLPHRVARM